MTLPSSSLSPISLSGSTSLGLSLPTGTTGSGVEIAPSSTLYASPLHYSVAATITTSGVREAVTLEDASAPSTYSFPVALPAGEFLSANPDGSVSVMRSFSGGSISVGEFLAPWAKDATGTPVPTSYSVVGDTLVQNVETTPSTVFPVVADPMFVSIGYNGVTIRLTLNEQRFLVGGGSGVLILGACSDPATAAACAPVTLLVGGALAVLNGRGFCPSTDYFWATQGWMPWDGMTWGCRRY